MATQFITKEGHEKAIKELAHLKNVERKKISGRIQSAKELGDLSENAEYAEAKDDQAANESKITELEQMLKNMKIVEKTNSDTVEVGSTVKVKTEKGELKLRIVGSEESNPQQGLISNESPIGNALLSHKVGDKVEIEVPSGKIVYNIIGIE